MSFLLSVTLLVTFSYDMFDLDIHPYARSLFFFFSLVQAEVSVSDLLTAGKTISLVYKNEDAGM